MDKLFEKCPKCGSIHVEYNLHKRQWECLVRKCGWFVLAENVGSINERATKTYLNNPLVHRLANTLAQLRLANRLTQSDIADMLLVADKIYEERRMMGEKK